MTNITNATNALQQKLSSGSSHVTLLVPRRMSSHDAEPLGEQLESELNRRGWIVRYVGGTITDDSTGFDFIVSGVSK